MISKNEEILKGRNYNSELSTNVTPAKAGVYFKNDIILRMDSCLRRNDIGRQE